ncbi:MAG: hypothetical protein IKU14_10280 [Rhodocyclaceae bacterium]|nr:hypothetical protein [Rhodocyclaceae bacterium]
MKNELLPQKEYALSRADRASTAENFYDIPTGVRKAMNLKEFMTWCRQTAAQVPDFSETCRGK